MVGIETERGPWVQALLAAGYMVYAINPLQVARYRERHSTSGAKSDPADAHLLAEIVRLDRAHHRPIAGDSEIAEHVKVAARAHQTMIWSRVRQVNTLRSLLREYYPAALAAFGTDLADRDALAVLAAAPSPEQGRRLSQARIESLLRKAGRQRNIAATADQDQDRAEQRTADRPARGGARLCGVSASALIAVLTTMVAQTEVLAGQVEQGFGRHPDVEIYLSQPGLGTILGARVLAEFGDDPDRYTDAKSRKNYSGMSPITKASGTKRVVLARYARNRRLGDALLLQAYSALRASPGARAYYDQHRPAAPPTTKPSAPSRTGSSASSTAAWPATPATTNTAPGTPRVEEPPSPEPAEPRTCGIPPDQPTRRSAAAVNPRPEPDPHTQKLDRGEHRHTIRLRGIPPLTSPVVGCLVTDHVSAGRVSRQTNHRRAPGRALVGGTPEPGGTRRCRTCYRSLRRPRISLHMSSRRAPRSGTWRHRSADNAPRIAMRVTWISPCSAEPARETCCDQRQ